MDIPPAPPAPPAPLGYRALRRILFRLEPEKAHRAALLVLRLLPWFWGAPRGLRRGGEIEDPRLAQRLWGRGFRNPVGLAAGFDKDAVVVQALPVLGFGFAELGTVTPRPQPGNPRPRVFRYPDAASLENRLGFNNAGMAAMARRLARIHPFGIPLGINLGKNRDTPIEAAEGDYRELVGGLAPWCDFLVVNVSSPNTPGLRDLQDRRRLEAILAAATALTDRPILVKLAPDLAPAAARELCAAALGAGAAGAVLTNTTTEYSLLPGCRGVGGLSGRVLRERSYELLRAVAPQVAGRGVLVSVGGVDCGAEVYRRLRAGARLVELYTALVFRGPGAVGAILRELLALFERDGIAGLDEAVGADLAATVGPRIRRAEP